MDVAVGAGVVDDAIAVQTAAVGELGGAGLWCMCQVV